MGIIGKLFERVASLGAFLALAGVVSSILYFIGFNLKLLIWIDNWGPEIGWVIRIGSIVLGVAIYIFGSLVSKVGSNA